MTHLFDGRAFAEAIEQRLKSEFHGPLKNGTVPKLISLIVGENPGGKFYANLKKNKAAEIGIDVDIVSFPSDIGVGKLMKEVNKFNSDESVHGIMFQLPIGENFSDDEVKKILNSIDPKKDIDALGDKSTFIAPTASAVYLVLQKASEQVPINTKDFKVTIVGYTGFEGSAIFNLLKGRGYKVFGADSKTKDLRGLLLDSDIVISATGVADLIKKEMIKDGAVLIDVGSPKGDIDKSAYDKASFVSPVPGGVGPVTVVSLFENLLKTL